MLPDALQATNVYHVSQIPIALHKLVDLFALVEYATLAYRIQNAYRLLLHSAQIINVVHAILTNNAVISQVYHIVIVALVLPA